MDRQEIIKTLKDNNIRPGSWMEYERAKRLFDRPGVNWDNLIRIILDYTKL